MRLLLRILLALAYALLPVPAGAVLLSAGDGTGNTTPPADDPGWGNVGLREDLSAIYLGNRWVLTANHAGFGDAVFGGVTYTAVTGSKVRLKNPDDSNADLQMFKIVETPPLPGVVIAASPPPDGAQLTMIGHGRNRGTATSWMGIQGWQWGAGFTMRWGTNEVDRLETVLATEAIVTVFDASGLPDEAQGVVGDSGGAAFHKPGSWELSGVVYARSEFVGQPGQTSLFGNETYAADLSVYRAQILAHKSLPGCSDGLDDDLDGMTDYPADPGCLNAADLYEQYACEDGIDNDGDGWIDFPSDPGCVSAADHSEKSAPLPALGPAGLALLAALLALVARPAVPSRYPFAAETSSR